MSKVIIPSRLCRIGGLPSYQRASKLALEYDSVRTIDYEPSLLIHSAPLPLGKPRHEMWPSGHLKMMGSD